MLQESATTTAATAAVVHAGEGRVVKAFGNEILFKLTRAHTAGPLTLGLAMVPPGGGPPPHREPGDEIFIIVEGRYEFVTDGRRTEVGPGGVVFVPAGCAHAFRNIGDTVGRHWTFNLSGDFDQLFEKSAAVFAAPGPVDRARLVEIAREYGAEFV
ncbi:MAG TPA: cupin domain-containing protein [Gemmatimonadaceae bacterium]|nr:cupin domain-containing protein [Gemmatimonadaceae bacterium]